MSTPFLNFSRIICTNFRKDHASGFWGAGLCGWNCRHTFFAVFPELFSSTRCVRRKIVQNKKFNALSYVELFWWARVDSNNYFFGLSVPSVSENAAFKPLFGHGTERAMHHWNSSNAKSGLQSGLFFGARRVLGQHAGDGLRGGVIAAGDGVGVPAVGVHALAVAHDTAQLGGRHGILDHADKGVP